MLGYKSARYFSKLFYNNIGCFPGEYRKDVPHMREVPNEE
jgi:AraC-like DNA-binding protein